MEQGHSQDWGGPGGLQGGPGRGCGVGRRKTPEGQSGGKMKQNVHVSVKKIIIIILL